ncbi:MAG: TonB-dependent receptor plug domain-containing protein [Chlorobi bacterium]|nr:TonB-dependent receptor plug domain-containing protein [Chlorobiota bacterium]
MKKGKLLLTFLAAVLFSSITVAQGTVTGTVYDDAYGESLIGSSVLVKGTTTGTTTDINGYFSLELAAGSYTLEISYLGYDTKDIEVTVKEGQDTKMGKVKLKATSTLLDAVNIISDRAKERVTPVAVSNITKADLEEKLGSQDLPMIMNNTPSVYATAQGGGAGDARINVRGFNQRNVAIMINGVPVNDMENGWVYWSNWDGIADATASIQMQRGLSAVNLATPSIGGTMNIITSPAEMKGGVSAKFEAGSGSFFKTTITGHSGLINEKFAVSASIVRKVGKGVIDQTWTNNWAYYLGMSYNVSKNHRLEAYVLGAPQRHGQNLYKQNVATYNHEYAKELGVDQSTLDKFVEQSRTFNQNWAPVSSSYTGQQWWNGRAKDRQSPNNIMERENFFHKPLANLNWYAQWSKKISQFTTFYYSGGKGGGTGTYGKVYRRDANGELGDDDYKFYYGPSPWQWDWDATIAANQGPAGSYFVDKKEVVKEDGESIGILRNSRNDQWTIGGISKVKVKVSDNFKTQFGIDWRTASIDHYREVRDLLGGQWYSYKGNQFDTGDQYKKVLGDKIAYNNTNTVDWLGGYAQAEYTNGLLSAYGTIGYSMIKYSYTDHFKTAKKDANGDPDLNSGELVTKTDWIAGYQFKGGLNYNLSETFSLFGNVGYVSKVPILDAVIDDRNGVAATDPSNEKFTSFELGTIYSSRDNRFTGKANYYYTTWRDRTITSNIILDADGTNGIAFITGLDQRHSGLEFELNWRPVRILGIGGIASFANWQYLNDVNAIVKNYEGESVVYDTINVYASGLKVGDAPQTQFGLWATVYPLKGLSIQIVYRYNANHYAKFDPTTRTDETDTKQVWKTPSYSLLETHINYRLPLKGRLGVNLFLHGFNLLDALYVQDATDNSSYNGNSGPDGQFNHDVNRAEIFLGIPRTINAGVKITF